ncbi:hypothetical protein FBB35_15380 [Nostoc sp. TCL240-02]|nr:hypothetical protein FBB35_15380 [Nostoc sp. TCL240-02]
MGIAKRQGVGSRRGDEGDKEDKGDKGRIIQQVSPKSPPSSLSPLSLLSYRCPIPNAPCPLRFYSPRF